jgi:hypothetical protein
MKGESVEDLESGEDALLLGGSFLVNGIRGRVATRFRASHTLLY